MVMSEYALTFFIVVAAMAGMSLFMKRALQGRIRDAQQSMVATINARTTNYVKTPFFQYEPYYMNTSSVVDKDLSTTQTVGPSPGFSSGVFGQTWDESTEVRSTSNTISPRAVIY